VYDNWEAMGNPGWGWNDVEEYFERVSSKKSQKAVWLHSNAPQTWKLSPPESNSAYRTYDPSLYTPNSGPGVLGYTNYNPPSIDAFVESLPSIGIPVAFDLNSGNNIGGKHELNTLNPENQTRVSSYIAFWDTLVGRPNFKAITFAVVEKIIFQEPDNTASSRKPIAIGAEYSTVVNGTNQLHTVYARKEVILSAGTLQTPQVMMLSVRLPFAIPGSTLTSRFPLGHWTTSNSRRSSNPDCI
jgi:choline dehydrogenase-like flavoprotein